MGGHPRASPASHSTTSTRLKRQRIDDSFTDTEDQQSPTGDEKHKKKVRWDGASRDTEEGEEAASSEETDREGKICLTASCFSGKIGCAYYDPVKCIIHVLEDTQENHHFDLTRMLLNQVSPDFILTSSKADDNFMNVCRDYMDEAGGMFQIRPHKDFSPGKGRNRLLSLKLFSDLSTYDIEEETRSDIDSSSEPRNAYDFMRKRRDVDGDPTMRRWNASIRMSNFASVDAAPLCVGSMGALLDHLARECVAGDLENEGVGGLNILDIEMLSLDAVMQINADALYALQIFENESHASIHSDKTKEGLSLFGILNNTMTTLGRRLMQSWLLRPSLSIDIIKARHDAVACFTRSENLVAANVMHNHLKGMKNVPRILSVMRTGKAGIADWQGLIKFTFHSAMLRDTLKDLSASNDVKVIQKLVIALDISNFKEVGSAINETIDWEESTLASRICIRPHIDEELDNRKHVYNGIDAILSKVARDISETIPPNYATSLNVVYFPQLGFLICVPMLDEWRMDEGVQALNGWTFQFSSESHVYFKSDKMHDLDTHIGDLYSSIVDREIEIIHALKERILVYDQAITKACDTCAELDCLLCFASASTSFNYCRPRMSEENVLLIKRGRHPLQEQIVDTFVPNDIFLVGGAGIDSYPTVHASSDDDDLEGSLLGNSVLICTGANACGKSVFLRQTALIQFMAQIGCFVPAESATLGIVDKIFTRISSRESVSKVQSSLMIDLNQVSLALRNSTARSLILLDEFGKGTLSAGSCKFLSDICLWISSPAITEIAALTTPALRLRFLLMCLDGAGLFCGVLKHLISRGPDCPKVVAATHFYELFQEGTFNPRILPVSFVHMEVMFTTSDGDIITASKPPKRGGEDAESTNGINPGEKITYLYRVASGLSLHAHAANCAEIFGIPHLIAQRAQYVSQLLETHNITQLLDEEMTVDERQDLEDAEEICRRFLAWDIDSQLQEDPNGLKTRLNEVLGRATV